MKIQLSVIAVLLMGSSAYAKKPVPVEELTDRQVCVEKLELIEKQYLDRNPHLTTFGRIGAGKRGRRLAEIRVEEHFREPGLCPEVKHFDMSIEAK